MAFASSSWKTIDTAEQTCSSNSRRNVSVPPDKDTIRRFILTVWKF